MKLDLGLTEETELRPGNGTDLVIRLGLPAEKSVVGVPLASARHALCASPAYLARRRAPATPEEVAAHDCLSYRRESEPLVWMFEAGDGGGQQRAVEVSGPLRSNSGEALRHAALDGLGLALLPAWMVGRDVSAGRLVACLPEHRAHLAGYQAAIYAVHARGSAVPAKVIAFVAHLRAALAPMGGGLIRAGVDTRTAGAAIGGHGRAAREGSAACPPPPRPPAA